MAGAAPRNCPGRSKQRPYEEKGKGADPDLPADRQAGIPRQARDKFGDPWGRSWLFLRCGRGAGG